MIRFLQRILNTRSHRIRERRRELALEITRGLDAIRHVGPPTPEKRPLLRLLRKP